MPSTTTQQVQVSAQSTRRSGSTLVAALSMVAWLGAIALALPATAQQTSKPMHANAPVIAVEYTLERAKSANIGGDFWLQGAGADIAVPVYHQFSIAGSVSGAHAGNIAPGVDLNKLTFVAGPRYTCGVSRVSIFGQGLFGAAHGFQSVFPAPGATTPTANSFAMQIGGGMDIFTNSGFGVRAFELDYVRTGFPNNGTNSQNDFRLGFGVSYRFKRK